jgi:hypothetical protein
MLKQSEVSKEIKTVSTKEFSIDELNKALFDFEDLMERCQTPFFLIGDTGKGILDGFLLRGDKVEVAFKASQLTDMVISTIDTYKGVKLSRETGKWTYFVDEVPVEVTIITKKYKFFENPDSTFYFGENYWLPNPYTKYYKSRYLIK